jgi:imidazolonepropionase-like amidohydrolase
MKKLVTGLLLMVAYAFAAESSTVAIRNAKIVTVSGPVIAKGTVVVRNGLITAVGETVEIPADAFVVDGEGLTVYPGLIDAMSTLGFGGASTGGAAAAGGAGRGGRGGGAVTATPAAPAAAASTATRSMGPEDRPQTTSWEMAVDEISAADGRIPTVRASGVTTAVTFPTRGIFGGQGAIIDLITGEKAGEMIVTPAVGQYISIGRGGGFGGGGGGGGFPSSLMGYIAYVKQIYLDAEHYKMAKEAYEKDPHSMERPPYDRALEGVLASKRILLPANRAVEIDRVLRVAAELKQPTILYGGRETYRADAVDLLKKSGTPLLVSLRWPELPRGEIDPDNEPSMRSLEAIEKAPSAPGVLKKAGVRFALYSDGLEQPRDLQRAVKKAIDAGLSREDAIRAMTLSPAEIYGVSDRLGSIEKGKIGNLVVTRGEIFDDRTQVVWVIVDGRHYKPAETAAPAGRGAATEEPGGNQ